MPPVWFRSAKMRPNSEVISCAISVWIAATVFSLLRERILNWPLTTDLSADFHQFFAQFLETAKLRDLLLRFTHCRVTGQRLGYRFAVEFISDAQVRTWPGSFGMRK
jgi:hypothetical protein